MAESKAKLAGVAKAPAVEGSAETEQVSDEDFKEEKGKLVAEIAKLKGICAGPEFASHIAEREARLQNLKATRLLGVQLKDIASRIKGAGKTIEQLEATSVAAREQMEAHAKKFGEINVELDKVRKEQAVMCAQRDELEASAPGAAPSAVPSAAVRAAEVHRNLSWLGLDEAVAAAVKGAMDAEVREEEAALQAKPEVAAKAPENSTVGGAGVGGAPSAGSSDVLMFDVSVPDDDDRLDDALAAAGIEEECDSPFQKRQLLKVFKAGIKKSRAPAKGKPCG